MRLRKALYYVLALSLLLFLLTLGACAEPTPEVIESVHTVVVEVEVPVEIVREVEVTRIVVWTPTPEGAEADDDVVDDYLTTMTDLASAYESVAEELLGRFSIGNVQIEDDDWRAEVFDGIDALRELGEAMYDIEPPDEYADQHQELLELAESLDQAGALVEEGIDEYDAGEYQSADVSLSLGALSMGAAAQEIIIQVEEMTE